MNQPQAGFANYLVLLESVMPVIEAYDGDEMAIEYFEETENVATELFTDKVNQVFRVKMGFPHDSDVDSNRLVDGLWRRLRTVLRDTRADWTLFWRRLYEIAKQFPVWIEMPSSDYEAMARLLIAADEQRGGPRPFYIPLDNEQQRTVLLWIKDWREALVDHYNEGEECGHDMSGSATCLAPEERMRLANPKYVLREWMLVEAYTKASPSSYLSSSVLAPAQELDTPPDESLIHELFELIQNPYDEGTDEQERTYYRRAPDETLHAGGTAYMS